LHENKKEFQDKCEDESLLRCDSVLTFRPQRLFQPWIWKQQASPKRR